MFDISSNMLLKNIISYPAISIFIGAFLFLKFLSILMKFKDRTWKTAAIVAGISTFTGGLFNIISNKVYFLNFIILILLIKYIYKERWIKSILIVIIMTLIVLILHLFTTGLIYFA